MAKGNSSAGCKANTVQEEWAQAAADAIAYGTTMTRQELFDMGERNTGWIHPEEARMAWGLPEFDQTE